MLLKAPARQKPRQWLVLIDYLFYLLLAAALVWFLSYLYSFKSTITLYLPFLLQAAGTTLTISVVSMVLATIFGLLVTWCRRSGSAVLRWIAIIYIEVVRGTPTLVQLLLWGFGIGTFVSNLGFDPHGLAFRIMTVLQSNSLVSPSFNFIFYGIIGLSFNYAAYLTEVFRTGIESVNRGQSEAALSLGMDSSQTMRRIVMPQAIRITIPPFTNYFITLLQDSALLSVIGVTELQQVVSSFAYPQTNANTKFFIFILGALFYLALCYPLTLLARYLERRLGKS